MIKTILAFVEGGARTAGFIEAMLAIAEHRRAHLIVDVLTPAPLVSPALAPLGTLHTLPFEMRRLAEDNVQAVRTLLPADARAEVTSHMDAVGWIPGDVRHSAPLADLVAIGPAADWTIAWLRRRTIETLVLASGTPLILLPSGRSIRSVAHAVLGWKPGPAAARAVHDLVSVAAPGARIDVVTVKRGGDDQPEIMLEPVTAMLARHGFCVEGHGIDANGSTADALTAFSLDRGADLLAVGGFAHSRIREIVLGGVTRSLIDDPRLPVLMAH